MTLFGPGVIAAITPNTTNETNSSGSMRDSWSVSSESHPAAWILTLCINDTQAGVELIQVDVATANVACRSRRIKRSSAVLQALVDKYPHFPGMDFEFEQDIA